MGKHTPGPWKIHQGGGHKSPSIRGSAPIHTNGEKRNAQGISSASYSEEVCEIHANLSLPGPKANANFIVTAVNVMPEVIDFLIELLNQDLDDSMTKKNIDLLEKLSGHKLCPDCGAELVKKDTYGMDGDECWDWCPECERMVP